MMKTRQELHEILCDILGSRNCYFSPPSNIRMKYPCFVYHCEGALARRADNMRYLNRSRYTITFISEDPDDKLLYNLDPDNRLPYLSLDRTYISDGMNHSVYTVYW